MSANQSPNTNGWVESAKNTANTAGESVAGAAKATRDYVANAANSTTNTAQQKKEETSGVLSDTAQKAREHVANAADSVSKAAKPEEEKTPAPGFLQQTGTAVVNTAQGAVEAVKNTIGMNDKK
ncbi:hypothetical protein MKW92_051755 [Papaver armeniacum]|nr:hypothetical protein MKW92_051753 [Papaver armeniacum]KAI3854437.1 hypothetical protein MKW92_051755 [Papaver armeniacum]